MPSLVLTLLLACAEVGPIEPASASATDAAADPAGALGSEQVLATWSGGAITWGELEPEVAGDLRAMEIEYLLQRYEVMSQAVDRKVMDALLEAEAERRGLAGGVDELLTVEIEAKVPVPSDAEVAALYPVMQRQLGGASLEEATPWLRMEILQRAQADAFRVYLDALRASAELEITLPYPDLPRADLPVSDHDPVRGPADAPVTIVQFAEYQCYYCNKVLPTLVQLAEAYPDEVRMVFKDFPLSGHGRALPAAHAAHCAGDQGKYWPMYELLLANQHALEDADLAGYATTVGLDVAAWEECVASGRHAEGIEADMALAREVGVQATPTFYVNGIVVAGAQPFTRFADIVDRELGR